MSLANLAGFVVLILELNSLGSCCRLVPSLRSSLCIRPWILVMHEDWPWTLRAFRLAEQAHSQVCCVLPALFLFEQKLEVASRNDLRRRRDMLPKTSCYNTKSGLTCISLLFQRVNAREYVATEVPCHLSIALWDLR